MMIKTISIYGVLPPPFGGMSIHLLRLKKYLEDKSINVEFYDERDVSLKKVFLNNLNFRKEIIHVHGYQHPMHTLLLVILVFFFRKKIIVTIHNDRFILKFSGYNIFAKVALKLFYSKISALITVNPLTDFNNIVPSQKTTTIPPFLPPASSEIDISNVPDKISIFTKNMDFLITANASAIAFHENEDLYGIDICIKMMRQIIKKNDKVGCVFVISDIGKNMEYFKKMVKLVKDSKLQNNFMFYTEKIKFPALLNISDLFVRPTNTDGDAISIREAIFLNKPVISSDAVVRPEGVVLFKNRDESDLYNKTLSVIDNYSHYVKRIKNIESEDNGKKLLDLYNDIEKRKGK